MDGHPHPSPIPPPPPAGRLSAPPSTEVNGERRSSWPVLGSASSPSSAPPPAFRPHSAPRPGAGANVASRSAFAPRQSSPLTQTSNALPRQSAAGARATNGGSPDAVAKASEDFFKADFEAELGDVLELSTALQRSCQQPIHRLPPPISPEPDSPSPADLLAESEELRHSQNETLREVILKQQNVNDGLVKRVNPLEKLSEHQADVIVRQEQKLGELEVKADTQTHRIAELEKQTRRLVKAVDAQKRAKEDAEAVAGGIKVGMIASEEELDSERKQAKALANDLARTKQELSSAKDESATALNEEKARTGEVQRLLDEEKGLRNRAAEENVQLTSKVEELKIAIAELQREKSLPPALPRPPAVPPIVTSLKRKASPSPSPSMTASPAQRRVAETPTSAAAASSSSRDTSVDPGYTSSEQKGGRDQPDETYLHGPPAESEGPEKRADFTSFWIDRLFKKSKASASLDLICSICKTRKPDAPLVRVPTADMIAHLQESHKGDWDRINQPGGVKAKSQKTKNKPEGG